ncbi:MAG: PKD domain-containing protein, partial [Myxococcota bacterium]|nr:PKD domain-containing protein [Myxococcota bacterium]
MAQIRIAAFGTLTLLSLAGCRNEAEKADTAAAPCDAPIANAGADLTTTLGGPVTLDAGASAFCQARGDDVTFEWSFEAVPTDSTIDTSALSDNQTVSAVQPVFTPDVVGDYTLGLVVSDGVDTSEMNYVVVSVVSGDQRPVADCGPNAETTVGVAASLDGSASYDPEGAALEYLWSLSDLPGCSGLSSDSIYNSAGPTPSVVPDCEGVFTVTLVVSDSINYSDPSICTVEAGGVNDRPIASAGPSLTLGACADDPLALDGTGSYDP